MKKIKKYKTELLKTVFLYKDDLEKIIEVFKEASGDVKINIGEYILDDLGEIESLREEVFYSLNIMIDKPHITLDIDKEKVSLGEFEGTAEARGIFEKVKQILIERKRKLSWFLDSDLIGLILISLAVIGGSLLNKLDIFVLSLGILIAAILSIIWVLMGKFNIKWYSKIHLRRKTEFPSFWRRKKDDIILAVISAIIGSLITFLGLLLFKLL